ncbi:MAG: hypothetical protein J6X69_03795 [Bacteroidales bacterium]|nr:hypothetical protein [Bacteroidales bacterium]
MMIEKYFCVAGHRFGVRCPDWVLSSYEPFEVKIAREECLFFLEVMPEDDMPALLAPYRELTRCNEEPPYLWLYENKVDPALDDVLFGFSLQEGESAALLEIPADLRQPCRLKVRRRIARSELDCCVNNALMLLYTLYTTPFDTLMIHSSVTVFEGKGYSFLGKSGTGKSTHSSLWLKYIEGTWLLNDDNPVIRLEADGTPYIYGTPWSGKTPCYKNERVPLGAIVRLEQAPYNKITRLKGLEAYTAFLPSCSSLKWKRSLEDALCRTVETVVSKVGVWHLECLPDEAAARLSNSSITR